MSANFECFVTINDKKHSICLNKGSDFVVFGEILKQLTKFNVFFDSHLFEIFDFEINSFKRLTTIETPIKYLSRIRVLPKTSTNNVRKKAFKETKPPVNRVKGFTGDKYVPNDRKPMNRSFNPIFSGQQNPRQRFVAPNADFNDRQPYYRRNDFNRPFPSPAPPLLPSPDGFGLYSRRPVMSEPIAGSSRVSMNSMQPYYRRESNDDYFDIYVKPEVGPNYPPAQPFPTYRNHNPFNGPQQVRSSYDPNWTQNRSFQMRNENRYDMKPYSRSSAANESTNERKNQLKKNGFSIRHENSIEKYFCNYCQRVFQPIVNAFLHLKSSEHRSKSSEDSLDPLDRLFMIGSKLQTNVETHVRRRQELKKFNAIHKQMFVRHGIRLKDGVGGQAYVCTRCCVAIQSSELVHKHFNRFAEINKTIHYPEDYHRFKLTAEEEGCEPSVPKVELRYQRILNALELLIDESRTEQELKQLQELRDEGIICKEAIDQKKPKFYSCLVCDQKLDSMTEAFNHYKSDTHLKNKTPDHFKGIDKSFLTDSERSGQLEVLLARKQELEKMDFLIKEQYLCHGIRLKDGIGAEAYVCISCDQLFVSSRDVKIHVEEYDNKTTKPTNENKSIEYMDITTDEPNVEECQQIRIDSLKIIESTEESLIGFAKTQIELLSEHKNENEMDFNVIETNSVSEEKTENLIDLNVIETNPLTEEKTENEVVLNVIKTNPLTEEKTENEVVLNVNETNPLTEEKTENEVVLNVIETNPLTEEKTENVMDLNVIETNRLSEEKTENLMDLYVIETNSLTAVKDKIKVKITETDLISEPKNDSEVDSIDEIELLAETKNEIEIDLTIDEMELLSEPKNFTDQDLEEQGIQSEAPTALDTNEKIDAKYYDIFCNIHFENKGQAIEHLNRPFHSRQKSGEFMKSIDKAFCVESTRLADPNVAKARVGVLNQLDNEVKTKFTKEGIRLKDGVGSEAYVCIVCDVPIMASSVESGLYAFQNHINYYQKHIEYTISQNE